MKSRRQYDEPRLLALCFSCQKPRGAFIDEQRGNPAIKVAKQWARLKPLSFTRVGLRFRSLLVTLVHQSDMRVRQHPFALLGLETMMLRTQMGD